jgi:hypothetical protein
MRLVLSATFLMLFTITFGLVSNAQTVPASVKKEILAYLKKQEDCKSQYVQFRVESVKLGPKKSGFIGSCRYGGGISVVYEKTSSGLVKLLQVWVQMNGDIMLTDKANKGYYDISVYGSSGGEVYGTAYRWNGKRYYEYKSNL